MREAEEQQVQANLSRLKEIAWGLTSTAALVVAIRLRLAEELESGPRHSADLAKATGTDAIALRQLLDALVARGVFERNEGGTYAQNGLSALLRENDPNSVSYFVQWIGYPAFWNLWPHLEGAVREGKPQAAEAFGKEFFRYIHEDDPQAVHVFNRAMTQASNHTSKQVVDALNLDGAGTVADIGGGQGRLIRSVLEKHPETKGVLLDLEGVVANALPELKPGGEFADRMTLLGGDCRRDIPVEADVYLFKNILDWDDANTVKALGNAKRNAKPGARVVIIETLTDATPEPKVTTSLDLLLLVNVGGRKHDGGEVLELFRRAGIRPDGVRPTGTFLSLIEGTVAD